MVDWRDTMILVLISACLYCYSTAEHPGYGQPQDQCQSKSDCHYGEDCVRICSTTAYETTCKLTCVPAPSPVQKIPCHYDGDCHYNQYCSHYKTCECNVGYKVDPYKPSNCISAYTSAEIQTGPSPPNAYVPAAYAYVPLQYSPQQHPVATYEAPKYPPPEQPVAYPPPQQLPGYHNELKAQKYQPPAHQYPPPAHQYPPPAHQYPPPASHGGRYPRSNIFSRLHGKA